MRGRGGRRCSRRLTPNPCSEVRGDVDLDVAEPDALRASERVGFGPPVVGGLVADRVAGGVVRPCAREVVCVEGFGACDDRFAVRFVG